MAKYITSLFKTIYAANRKGFTVMYDSCTLVFREVYANLHVLNRQKIFHFRICESPKKYYGSHISDKSLCKSQTSFLKQH